MSIINLIGNTPLVEIQHLSNNPKVRIFCKLEGQNPGGSVKDRAALNMLQTAINNGDIKVGGHVIEATSGNTGIALAMIAKALGVQMHLVMPDNSTVERIKTMRAYGAEVILTPAAKTIEYSREYAEELSIQNNYYLLNQFANNENWRAHYKTTGPEIYRDTNNEITHFVSAMGTTGTIMGVSSFLKEQNKEIQIVGVQPKDGASIPGIRRWSPEFLPAIFQAEKVDRIIDVSQEEAEETCRLMAKEESIFAGVSSGGALFAALKLSQELEEGIIVCITCDRGDRYLSSPLFEG